MEKNKIFEEGIYFRQFDIRKDGHEVWIGNERITEKVKEPTFWTRLIYFVKYGSDYKFEPILTIYFNFFNNKIFSQCTTGDAITVAEYVKNNGGYGIGSSYSINGNIVEYEDKDNSYILTFSDDFLVVDVHTKSKLVDKKEWRFRYNFLNWNNI